MAGPEQLTATEATREIRAGRLSCPELLKACLARIDEMEDRLRAWALLDREGAEAAAVRLQEEARREAWRGPLHGVPVGIKDIMFTRGLRTAGGSRLLEDFVPDYDATVVSRLREAGAVVLGKTVTTEFACFDPSDTRNPWNLEHTPGGSSSGSAAAVASRMCPVALGSQTGGSISRPAAYCGIAGLKPSLGRVSLHGIFQVSYNLDHPGPIARSTEDLALVLQVIAGQDSQDPFCSSEPVPDYVGALGRATGNPPRIALVGTYFLEAADEEMREATHRAADVFRSRGAVVIDVALPESFQELHRMHRIVMAVDAASYHADRFREHAVDYGPNIRSLVEEGMSQSAVAYADARRHQISFQSEIRSAFAEVDILLTPATMTPAPAGLSHTGDPAFNSPWSYAGLPTVVLPVGLAPNGLPTGVQLVGRHFAEAELLAAAGWCESHLGWEAAPALGSEH